MAAAVAEVGEVVVVEEAIHPLMVSTLRCPQVYSATETIFHCRWWFRKPRLVQ